MIVKTKAKITGRVQGVFYRQTTKQKALELNLTGWVRNLDDGSVEIEVVGPAETVQKLIDWCKVGPAAAVVEKVEIIHQQEDPNSAERKFEII